MDVLMCAGLPVYFIEPLHPAKLFWRGQFYSEPDDFRRFTYFCRAAMEFLLQSGKRPDIIHSHDWQTAVVVILMLEIVHLGVIPFLIMLLLNLVALACGMLFRCCLPVLPKRNLINHSCCLLLRDGRCT